VTAHERLECDGVPRTDPTDEQIIGQIRERSP
jgi:hypothetical protein